ncbi:MAG TPA: hypothetical protein DCQ98_13695, partial [Planctomycetaceae bacterium]|nr:hypothetical protein [Planctomycetaceae bacterium]
MLDEDRAGRKLPRSLFVEADPIDRSVGIMSIARNADPATRARFSLALRCGDVVGDERIGDGQRREIGEDAGFGESSRKRRGGRSLGRNEATDRTVGRVVLAEDHQQRLAVGVRLDRGDPGLARDGEREQLFVGDVPVFGRTKRPDSPRAVVGA